MLLSLALVPSALLSLYGWRSIALEERGAEQQARERARGAELRLDASLARRLDALGERVRGRLGGVSASDRRGWGERAERLEDDQSLVATCFLVPRGGAPMVTRPLRGAARAWPKLSRGAPLDARAREGVESFMREARAAERGGDPAWAALLLEQAATVFEVGDARSIIDDERAQLALARGELGEAIERLSRLYFEAPDARRLDGSPIALRAFMQLAESLQQRRAGGLGPGAPLLALAEALAVNRWGLSRATLDAHFDLVHRSLEELAVERSAGEAGAARLEAQLSRLERRRAFEQAFEARFVPEIERLLRTRARGSLDPITVELVAFDRRHLYLVAPLSEELEAGYAGCEVDLRGLLISVESELTELASPFDAHLAVAEGGRLIAGHPGLLERVESGAGRPLLASVRGWTAVAEPRDPGAPARAARALRSWVGVLLGSCFFAAFVGGVLAVRSLDRQVALAEMRTRLVRNVSHELRTPVASVLMLAEILEEGGLPREREREYFRRIAIESRRLGGLVESVLSYANIEQGARRLELISSPLGASVASLLEDFRASELGRGCELRFDDATDGARALVDREALGQVLTNLLSNGLKYGGTEALELRLARARGGLCVSLRDHGRGIPEGERERMFVPFAREHPEDTSAPGIGIGLTIVRELVHRMHGEVRIEEPETGGGACFVVWLPCHTA